MGSRFFKSLFFGSSNNGNKSQLKDRAGAYEATVALEPPVKGSYPVAGNGPNVEETLQRARLKREARQNETKTSTLVGGLVSRTPSRTRSREAGQQQAQVQRPRTAPHSGLPQGQFAIDGERTRSGFSTTAPPPSFSTRRDSLRSMQFPPPTEPLPALPTKQRQVHTYQPTKGPTPSSTPAPVPISAPAPVPAPLIQEQQAPTFVPPFTENHHQRNFSRSSHVDILDAYSSIKPSATKQRVKAAGVRNYGEDVADRNIADFGDKDLQKLDLNSPEFAYLKSIYASKKRQADNNGTSGWGNGNETPQETDAPRHHATATSTYETAPGSGRIPSSRFSPVQDEYVTSSSHRYGGLSPVSLKSDDSATGSPRRKDNGSIDLSSLPRGRQVVGHIPPPVAPPHRISSLGEPPRIVSPVEVPRSASSQSSSRVTSPGHSRQPSANKQSQHQGRVSRSSSVTYSAFPSISPRESSALDNAVTVNSKPIASPSKRMYLVEETKETPNLQPVVAPKRTADADVTTKTLPAVTLELVEPRNRLYRQERMSREIHDNHDYSHHFQSANESELQPPNHYASTPHRRSLFKPSEEQIPSRMQAELASDNWGNVPRPSGQGDHYSTSRYQHHRQESSRLSFIPPQTIVDDEGDDDAAESPVISLSRNDTPKSRSRASSKASSMHTPKSNRTKSMLEPILASKRDSVTSDGISRKEYLWRHQNQFENFSRPSSSRSNPVYVGAGVGDLSAEGAAVTRSHKYRKYHHSIDLDDEYSPDEAGSRKDREGEELLFRDSGYGSIGGLPGISESGHSRAYSLTKDSEKLESNHKSRRSGGSGVSREVLVERDGEDSGDAGDEEYFSTEYQRPKKTRRYLREVRARKSSGDLRSVASKQEGELRQ